MTDLAFTILDELYFISSFKNTMSNTDISEIELKEELWKLIDSDLVKCLDNEQDVEITLALFELNFKSFHYIATKTCSSAHHPLF